MKNKEQVDKNWISLAIQKNNKFEIKTKSKNYKDKIFSNDFIIFDDKNYRVEIESKNSNYEKVKASAFF